MTSPMLPVVDLAALCAGDGLRAEAVHQLGSACREYGFFYLTNHGINRNLTEALECFSRRFFRRTQVEKNLWHLSTDRTPTRGYLPVEHSLNLVNPCRREGLHFEVTHSKDFSPVWREGSCGISNVYPNVAGWREVLLIYAAQATRVGHAVLEGVALSLGLAASHFRDGNLINPHILFRVYNYPSHNEKQIVDSAESTVWGVGEHRDEGLLTVMHQNCADGLEVETTRGWINVPTIPGALVCNLGKATARMTNGQYRSSVHRVACKAGVRDRMSFPVCIHLSPTLSATPA